ncbi:MAG TPA: [NiFe]-hydrogenase assembly chaperone HybE [Albitalea sp.]
MAACIHLDDPAPALEAAFRRIQAERMAGVPLLHAALQVQAVGFARWQGQWLGALVTPWFLNLVLVPGEATGWRSAAEGQRVFHRFAAGDFAFLGNDEPELGEFQTCSLCSPMHGFPDQTTACTTGRMALRMLHVKQPAATLMSARGCERDVAPAPSRRSLLFGRAG